MQIVDPPESKRARTSEKWTDIVEALKNQHPGKYGLVGNYSVGVAAHIRNGDYPAFVQEGVSDKKTYVELHWDVTTRRTPDGRNDVYVKWIGQGCPCRDCL